MLLLSSSNMVRRTSGSKSGCPTLDASDFPPNSKVWGSLHGKRECAGLTQRAPSPTQSAGARHREPRASTDTESAGARHRRGRTQFSTWLKLPDFPAPVSSIPKSSDADRKTPMLVELCAETEASQKITTQPSHPCSNKCRLKYSSTCWRLRVSMANYTLADLLLFSAGAILLNYIYIYILFLKISDCISLDAGDSRCHGRSFSMEKKNGWPRKRPSMALTIMG